VKHNVPASAVVVVNDYTWPDLRMQSRVYPVWIWKIDLDPWVMQHVLPHDWRSIDYIVWAPLSIGGPTAALDQLPTLRMALAHAKVLKRFGDGISVYKVVHGGRLAPRGFGGVCHRAPFTYLSERVRLCFIGPPHRSPATRPAPPSPGTGAQPAAPRRRLSRYLHAQKCSRNGARPSSISREQSGRRVVTPYTAPRTRTRCTAPRRSSRAGCRGHCHDHPGELQDRQAEGQRCCPLARPTWQGGPCRIRRPSDPAAMARALAIQPRHGWLPDAGPAATRPVACPRRRHRGSRRGGLAAGDRAGQGRGWTLRWNRDGVSCVPAEPAAGLVGVDFHFDIMCPWAYQASLWIRDVREQLRLDVRRLARPCGG
jgi:hypothetical protein